MMTTIELKFILLKWKNVYLFIVQFSQIIYIYFTCLYDTKEKRKKKNSNRLIFNRKRKEKKYFKIKRRNNIECTKLTRASDSLIGR